MILLNVLYDAFTQTNIQQCTLHYIPLCSVHCGEKGNASSIKIQKRQKNYVVTNLTFVLRRGFFNGSMKATATKRMLLLHGHVC